LLSAARSFGKFQDSFLTELYNEITTHIRQETPGVGPQIVAGMTVHDSEVLEAEPVRQGGLMQMSMVRHMKYFALVLMSYDVRSGTLSVHLLSP
jgi:hypothetical protein